MNCKLCECEDCRVVAAGGPRSYRLCPRCGLIFVPPDEWITLDDERARYVLHDNGADDDGYVSYLTEVADEVERRAPRGARILDFGSGPAAVLTGILRAKGFACAAYDPLYGIGRDALRSTYDVVVMCEVIEHLRELRRELFTIRDCLAPHGRVVVKTRVYGDARALSSWWYARDPTHVNFFSAATVDTAAHLLGAPLVDSREGLFVMSRP